MKSLFQLNMRKSNGHKVGVSKLGQLTNCFLKNNLDMRWMRSQVDEKKIYKLE